MFREDEWFDHPGVPTEVVDTVGAGDAFTAAVTLGLLAGWTWKPSPTRPMNWPPTSAPNPAPRRRCPRGSAQCLTPLRRPDETQRVRLVALRKRGRHRERHFRTAHTQ